MNFVVCSEETYSKIYEREAYMYPRLHSYEDLVGYRGIEVRVHESDIPNLEDQDMELRLETLSDFGYIKLIYVDDDGIEDKHFPKEAKI